MFQESQSYKKIKLNIIDVNNQNMKNPTSQPMSYKDFMSKLNQVDKAKEAKKTLRHQPMQRQSKISQNEVIKSNNKNYAKPTSPHTQSTSLWDKSTSRKKKIPTQSSISKQTRSHNQSVYQNQSKPSNFRKKDRMMAYHKFIEESMQVLSKILKTPGPQLLNERISYIGYLEAMKSLKLIHENYQPYPNDLISEFWSEFISGENIGNFLIAISSILGHYTGNQTQTDNYLHKKYQSLKFTRMELSGSQFEEKDNSSLIQCTFMPQISDRSRKIATSCSKSKQKNGKPLHCLHTDRSNLSRSKLNSKNISIDQYDENTYRMNTQYCIPTRRNDQTGNKRSQILYKMGKQKSAERLPNKTKNDYEYEKSIENLTFKPKIHVNNKSRQKYGKTKVKGENSSISRMIKGRVERQVLKIINQKGLPYNEKMADKMRKQRYQKILTETNIDLQEEQNDFDHYFKEETEENLFQSSKNNFSTYESGLEGKLAKNQTSNDNENLSLPLSQLSSTRKTQSVPEQDLVIDVYISEEHKQKLIIRKGDSLCEVANNFIREHNLPECKKDQLIQLLEASLTQALSPIDELVQEQELASARTQYKRQQYIR